METQKTDTVSMKIQEMNYSRLNKYNPTVTVLDHNIIGIYFPIFFSPGKLHRSKQCKGRTMTRTINVMDDPRDVKRNERLSTLSSPFLADQW